MVLIVCYVVMIRRYVVLILPYVVLVKLHVVLIVCYAILTIQSTLVISKSKGPSETLRDIRNSTYQICRILGKYQLNNQTEQMNM